MNKVEIDLDRDTIDLGLPPENYIQVTDGIVCVHESFITLWVHFPCPAVDDEVGCQFHDGICTGCGTDEFTDLLKLLRSSR